VGDASNGKLARLRFFVRNSRRHLQELLLGQRRTNEAVFTEQYDDY
jgi:hypothetical protein